MTRPGTAITAFALLVIANTPPLFAQTTPAGDPPRWNVVYPLAVWLPAYGADVTLPPDSPCAGCPPGIPSGSGSSGGLSSGWFGGLRLEFGRFEVLANYNYAGLTAEQETPFFNAEAQVFLATLMGGVRVYGPLFVEAGVRYQAVDATFNVLTFPSVKWEPSRWAPAVGAGYRTSLSRDWRLFGHFDWSGSGTSGLSALNGDARIEWRPWVHFAVTGGYGFARVRWNDNIAGRPIETRQTFHGPIVGVGIPF